MMRNSQNSEVPNELPSPIRDDEPSAEKNQPPKNYYYDDATGYEIYRDETEDEEERDPAEKNSEQDTISRLSIRVLHVWPANASV